ncbi:hypothetical protein ILUMI_17479, partial [Ignelater luminosus]
KKAWARPLKNKTSAKVINAFEKVFQQSGTTPENLQSDKGKEFVAHDTDNLIYFRVQYHDEYCNEAYIKQMSGLALNYFKEDETRMMYRDKAAWYACRIPAGDYENIQSIIKVINQHEIIQKLLNFEYDKTTKRVSLNMKDEVAFLGLSQRLCIQLEYEPGINIAKYPRPLHPANIWVGLPTQMLV